MEPSLKPFFCFGVSHATAGLSVRERLAFGKAKVGEQLELLSGMGVEECVLVSTCNRVEIYGLASNQARTLESLQSFWQDKIGEEGRGDYFYTHVEEQALKHLWRVSAGMESMLLGETEIFGQMKTAYRQASEYGRVKKKLHQIFQHAFRIGKEIRNQTKIQQGATSVAGVAVDLVSHIFGRKKPKTMIIGAGENARLIIERLVERTGEKQWQGNDEEVLFVANRNYEKAELLAEEMGGRAIKFDAMEESMKEVDVIISTTDAPHYVLKAEEFSKILRVRKGRPLSIFDLAVPRDVDPEIGKLEDVYLSDMDQLQKDAAKNTQARKKELEQCEKIIEENWQAASAMERDSMRKEDYSYEDSTRWATS